MRVPFLAMMIGSALATTSGCHGPGAPDGAAPASLAPDETTFLPDEAGTFGTERPAVSTPERPEDFARWERHPVRARSKAKALGRPLLILFTGLEWSSNARLLGEEVFLSKSFNALARDHLTLLFLDFPQNPSEAPESLRRFKEHFKVSGIPSVLLLSTEGEEVFRRGGYAPGKARDYFDSLRDAVLRERGVTAEASPVEAD